MPTSVVSETPPSNSSDSTTLSPADDERFINHRFVACKIGGMLMLKLTGFIIDEGAEIVSISENHATLQMGQPWYRRWVFGDRRRPIEVRIEFAEPGEDLANWQRANARRSAVDVQLRPLTRWYPTDEFQRRADSILKLLRLHFVAD